MTDERIAKLQATCKRLYFSGEHRTDRGKSIIERKARVLELSLEDGEAALVGLTAKYQEFLDFIEELIGAGGRPLSQAEEQEIAEFQRDLGLDEAEASALRSMHLQAIVPRAEASTEPLASDEEGRECAFCLESIESFATECRHCGERVVRPPQLEAAPGAPDLSTTVRAAGASAFHAAVSGPIAAFGQNPVPLRLGLFFVVNAGIVATLCLVLRTTPDAVLWAPMLGSFSAFVSLFFSKWLATRDLVAHYLAPGSFRDETEATLHAMVAALAERAGLPRCPQVGIYADDAINGFATGFSRGHALVMFSSGLVELLDEHRPAVEAIAAHEIAHVANGDMLTLTLVQAVVNSLIVLVSLPLRCLQIFAFFSQDASAAVEWLIGAFRWVLVFLMTLVGSLVVKWFSRFREFRADHGAALLTSRESMVHALRLLGEGPAPVARRSTALAALAINGPMSWLALFSTHPTLERRIAKLEAAPDLSRASWGPGETVEWKEHTR